MTQTCVQCGTTMEADDTFCGGCGRAAANGGGPVVLPTSTQTGLPGVVTAPGGRLKWPGSGDAARHSRPDTPADAALGQASPNAMYLGQRLLYDKTPEAPFDPIFNNRILFQMLRQWFLYWTILFVGAIAGGIFFAIASFAIGFTLGFSLWWIAGLICSLTAACLFWLLPLPALLSEWKFSVDSQGMAAPIVFEHIAWALSRRETPLDSIQVQRLHLPGEGVRDYLQLRRGLFTGYVGCFAYGQDLYVAWTFWVKLSPARWLLMVIARIWQNITHRGTDLSVTLRYDSARAMREAMHSATREGIDVAVGQLPAQGHGIVGGTIAVTEVASQ